MFKKILALSLTAFAFVFTSCGDDEIINNTPTVPVGTVLYARDTLQAVIEPGNVNMASGNTTSFSQNFNASKITVEFSVQSNADSSIGCSASYLDSTNGSPAPPSPLTINVYSPVDTTYSFTYDVVSQPVYSKFEVWMYIGAQPSAVRRYMRLVNIKVTKAQ